MACLNEKLRRRYPDSSIASTSVGASIGLYRTHGQEDLTALGQAQPVT